MSQHFPFLKVPLLLTVVILAIMAAITYSPIYTDLWAQYKPTVDFAEVFCEFTRFDHLVREPINTLTNIPYLFIGVLVIGVTARDSYRKNRLAKTYNNLLVRYPIYGYVLGIALVVTFLFSTFFHASLIAVAQQLDMVGVNSMILFPVVYSVHRIYNYYRFRATYESAQGLAALFLGLFIIAVTVLTLYKWQLNTMVVVPGLIGLSVILFVLAEKLCPNQTNKRWLAVSGFFIVAGMVFYVLDDQKIVCKATSIFQPHGLWHICAAAASLAMYFYLRSENMTHKFKQYGLHI